MNRQILKHGATMVAGLAFAGWIAAQEPEGDANDPAANQAANPARETPPARNPAPAAETYLPLTVDRFNRLDQDKDGALSAAELSEDDALEDRFEEMDADRNREIDAVEFRGFRPE